MPPIDPISGEVGAFFGLPVSYLADGTAVLHADDIRKMNMTDWATYRDEIMEAMRNGFATQDGVILHEKDKPDVLTCMYCAKPYPDMETLEAHESECFS